ncbi:Serine/threonine-protein kinase STN8, chloroplastic [Porphyridium purpureum]|uniref:Serine/threonine-protein kinase STN8, chloroplastic n=1 Tax=Porphyridium purpureum TaxID=35688 RepID=A0A5J4YY31_PORPP|nr:Serine/threonine-protein kinase STN8, chloroplastic [Porphyridium purpureum]|eukprot:POR8253..scf209_3
MRAFVGGLRVKDGAAQRARSQPVCRRGNVTMRTAASYRLRAFDFSIQLEKPLGEGSYGTVCPGVKAVVPDAGMRVVAKYAKADAQSREYLQVERDVNIFLHSNTLKFPTAAAQAGFFPAYLGSFYLQRVQGEVLIWAQCGEHTLDYYVESCDWQQLADALGFPSQYVQQACKPDLKVAITTRLLERILRICDYLHELHLVHRDIKPQNLLMDQELSAVRLIDFGSCALLRTRFGNTLGYDSNRSPVDPRYAAPERFLDPSAPTAFDLYSAALVALQVLLPDELAVRSDPAELQLQLGRNLYFARECMAALRDTGQLTRHGELERILETVERLCVRDPRGRGSAALALRTLKPAPRIKLLDLVAVGLLGEPLELLLFALVLLLRKSYFSWGALLATMRSLCDGQRSAVRWYVQQSIVLWTFCGGQLSVALARPRRRQRLRRRRTRTGSCRSVCLRTPLTLPAQRRALDRCVQRAFCVHEMNWRRRSHT